MALRKQRRDLKLYEKAAVVENPRPPCPCCLKPHRLDDEDWRVFGGDERQNLRAPGSRRDSKPGSNFAFAGRLVLVLIRFKIENGNSG